MISVKDFGAVGDGITKDTAAVQRAIDAGGTVCFPEGVYLCGTLYLHSGSGIWLEDGAVLKASPDAADYNADDFCPQNRVFRTENVSGAHFIVAVEQHDITIAGPGRIDGNRQAFYGEKSEPGVEKNKSKFDREELRRGWRPGQMIYFCECTHVQISSVSMTNAPYWTCFLHGCEYVQVTGIRILNDQRTFNGDGLDLDCCRFVTVSDCIIDSGDDCITLRGHVEPLKTSRACEYVTVSNCIIHTNCNAIRIGVGSGTIRNALFTNCIIHRSSMGIMLCSKYSETLGTRIEDIQFNNMRIEAEIPICVLTNAWGRQLGPSLNPIRGISFRQIRGSGESGCRIIGYDPGDVQDIRLEDVAFDWYGGDLVEPGRTDFYEHSPSPEAAFHAENVNGLTMHDCRVRWMTDHPAWKYGLQTRACEQKKITDCDFGKPDNEIRA